MSFRGARSQNPAEMTQWFTTATPDGALKKAVDWLNQPRAKDILGLIARWGEPLKSAGMLP